MKNPLLDQINRGMKATVGSAPAPVGGWNTRDSIANMNPMDAPVLDNFFPSSTSVDLRKGSMDWATGFPSRVKTLMNYASPTTTSFFGADDTGIYDITTGGAIGAAVTPLANGYCQYINFSTAAGSFLLSVNGQDKLKLYDGATWADIDGVSVPAITGLATTSIININAFKNRIWFTQRDSLDIWYLPVASIGGAATKFPLGGLFTRGGYLMSMGTWTVDGGGGVDDLAVFVTSEGEIAVYQGTDPASPTTWSLVGIYFISAPLGRRCFTKYGGDLLYLCRQGLYPISSALQSASVDKTIALSDKISPTFNESAQAFHSNLGWQTTIFTTANMLLVNVPAYVGSQSYQYVMNLITKSWCRFTDWNSSCLFTWDGNLYFGGENKVVQAWTGVSDNNDYITGTAMTAYSYLNSPGLKHFKLVRPIMKVSSSFDLYIAVTIDYDDNDFDYSIISSTIGTASLWDTAIWDLDLWGSGPSTVKFWNSVNVNDGYATAFKMQIRTKLSSVQWQSTDYAYMPGGVI